MNFDQIGPLVATAIGFFVLLFITVLLRVRSEGKVEIRPSDALVAIVPVLLVLLVGGYFKKFAFGAEGVTIETATGAILNASNNLIAPQTTTLPFAELESYGKGPSEGVNQMIADQTQVLAFDLGRTGYVGSVIDEYFNALLGQSFFRYVLFREQDGSFVGLCQAAPLAGYLRSGSYGGLGRFAGEIETRSIVGLIGTLPFCAGQELAVPKSSDKGDVLSVMETRQRDWLPVIDEAKHFAGEVDRTHLTSSLRVDVVRSLRAAQ